jgi:hypothetical protein
MDNLMTQLPKHSFTFEQVQVFKQRLNITDIPDGATHCWFDKLDTHRIDSTKPVYNHNFSKIDGGLDFKYERGKWEINGEISDYPNECLQQFIKISDIV